MPSTSWRSRASRKSASMPTRAGISPTIPHWFNRSRSRREPGNPASRFRVETRVLLRQQGEWGGILLPAGTRSRPTRRWWRGTVRTRNSSRGDFSPRPVPGRKWRFPKSCGVHGLPQPGRAKFVLGVTGSQLNRDHSYGGVRDKPTAQPSTTSACFTKALPKAPKRSRCAHRSEGMRPRISSAAPGRTCKSNCFGLSTSRAGRRQCEDGAGPVHAPGRR